MQSREQISKIVPKPERRPGFSRGLVCCECRDAPAKIGDYCRKCLDVIGERVRAELAAELADLKE
jgi:hypothetical protein